MLAGGLLLGLLLAPLSRAEMFNAPECRPFTLNEQQPQGFGKFSRGLLWEIKRDGVAPSHLFGTIHISDPAVLALPELVTDALDNSSTYVMELLPEPDQMMTISGMMFFPDEKRLNHFVSQPVFSRTVEILADYQLNAQAIAVMKPWAAMMTMSYPPQSGTILDLDLLQRAQGNGARIIGLEKLREQLDIFNDLELSDQVSILIDTVCHYDLVTAGFTKMKELYLQRDLNGLYLYNQRFAVPDDELYDMLMDRLLTRRNYIMVERLEPVLQRGNAFIAIGALHLTGEEGVLSLLQKKQYRIKLIY